MGREKQREDGMFTSISRVIFRLKFIMIAVATTVFVSGSAWAAPKPMYDNLRWHILNQLTTVGGRVAEIVELRGEAETFKFGGPHSAFSLPPRWDLHICVGHDGFQRCYSTDNEFGTIPGSTMEISEDMDSATLQGEDMPATVTDCFPDFTCNPSVFTTADIDLVSVGVGESTVFTEFGLRFEIQPCTVSGSVVTAFEPGLNIFGENVLDCTYNHLHGTEAP
jgi:hypothetical protein